MSSILTRRDLLKLAGGSALGLLLSPLPWKLLDDTSIWTQNWSLIPQLPRGPLTERISRCALCSAGCGVKALCVNDVPFRLSGLANDPIGRGILCPVGLAGHHMSVHPLRITGAYRFTGARPDDRAESTTAQEVLTEIASAIRSRAPGESVAILDQRPNRSLSEFYARFLESISDGISLLPPSQEDATSRALGQLTGKESAPFGYDFENTRTILNFGAPLFDGWGTPGRMYGLLDRRREIGWKLIHIEHSHSRTALRADQWIPTRPGTDAILALGVAHVIVRDRLYAPKLELLAEDFVSYRKSILPFTPEAVAQATGVSPDVIVNVARTFAQQTPSIAIVGGNPGSGSPGSIASQAVAGLNLLVGSVGVRGGLLAQRSIPSSSKAHLTQSLNEIPDHSVRVMIIDDAGEMSLPQGLIEEKLVPGKGIVVALASAWSPTCGIADYVVAVASPYASLTDLPAANDRTTATVGISAPLFPPTIATTDRAAFISGLAAQVGVASFVATTEEALLRGRVEAIASAKRGRLHRTGDGTEMAIRDVDDADSLWNEMVGGAIWIDEPLPQSRPKRFTLAPHGFANITEQLRTTRREEKLVLVPDGWRGTTSRAHTAPILSKIFQESGLRMNNGMARIHPTTADALGVADGDAAIVETSLGQQEFVLRTDGAMMPGVILAAVGPDRNTSTVTHARAENFLRICETNADGSWRVTEATLRKA